MTLRAAADPVPALECTRHRVALPVVTITPIAARSDRGDAASRAVRRKLSVAAQQNLRGRPGPSRFSSRAPHQLHLAMSGLCRRGVTGTPGSADGAGMERATPRSARGASQYRPGRALRGAGRIAPRVVRSDHRRGRTARSSLLEARSCRPEASPCPSSLDPQSCASAAPGNRSTTRTRPPSRSGSSTPLHPLFHPTPRSDSDGLGPRRQANSLPTRCDRNAGAHAGGQCSRMWTRYASISAR